LQQAFRQPQKIWSGRERSKKQEQVMKADQRLRVAAELGAARSGERADDFPLVGCANLAARLVQPVEQPSDISIYHICTQQSFYRKGRDGRKANRRKRIIGKTKIQLPLKHGGKEEAGDQTALS
jgi:hypothetical protein